MKNDCETRLLNRSSQIK